MGKYLLMFSIIIPTFNNIQYLKKCIESLKKNSKFNHEIIPHINIGSDGTEEYLIKQNERNGIHDFMRILRIMPSLSIIEFGVEDIVRSGLCKEYLLAKLEIGE